MPICYLSNISKSSFNNQYLKKRAEKKERNLNWMEGFKIKSRYVKLCYKLRTFIRFLETVFHRLDFQKFLMCPLIIRLGWAFVSKHAVVHLKHSDDLLKYSIELLKAKEKIKSLPECLESPAACFYYHAFHAVPISHGKSSHLRWSEKSRYWS